VLAFDAVEKREPGFDGLQPARVGVEGLGISPQLRRDVGHLFFNGGEPLGLRSEP
jgi:hypothetical protein